MIDVKDFEIGDVVTWESQAGGHRKKKTGVVVARVPENARPADHVPAGYKPPKHPGMPRRALSFLVYVKGSRRLYWPRAGNLWRVGPAAVQTTATSSAAGTYVFYGNRPVVTAYDPSTFLYPPEPDAEAEWKADT